LNFAVLKKNSKRLLEGKSLKEIVSEDILATSFESLELSQVNYLLQKEISAMRPTSLEWLSSARSKPTSYELSNQMIRLCLYQGTAINLACSIIDKSASIARKILLFDDDAYRSSLKTEPRVV
jgi:hypothetical protein